MDFEWDEAKRLSNLAKHGVDFVRAAKIFRNPVLEAIDESGDHSELRLKAIGQSEGDCFIVVYTWRGDSRRVISAWKARRHEQEEYYRRLGQRSEPD